MKFSPSRPLVLKRFPQQPAFHPVLEEDGIEVSGPATIGDLIKLQLDKQK